MRLTDYIRHARRFPRKVWFEGSVALVKGQGLCGNQDYGTAADQDERRDTYVELPAIGNELWFAGVAARDYSAKTGGQMVEIYEPGSVCQIALGTDVVVGAGIVTCSAGLGDPGRFGSAGFPGRGSAVPLQTVTGMLESDLTGASALDATGLILTDSSATFITNLVVAGDFVVLLGIEDDDTNSGTVGIYTIASVDLETQVTLTAAAADGGTMQVSYYVISGNPRCLARLLDGEPSGLIDYVMPPGKGHATADTFAISQTGVTFLLGGYTSATEAARAPLSAGSYRGMRKGIYCLGAVGGSYDIEIELDANGLQQEVSDAEPGVPHALHAITFDAADEYFVAEWFGLWHEKVRAGCAVAAS